VDVRYRAYNKTSDNTATGGEHGVQRLQTALPSQPHDVGVTRHSAKQIDFPGHKAGRCHLGTQAFTAAAKEQRMGKNGHVWQQGEVGGLGKPG
jgi:hypothetical protein